MRRRNKKYSKELKLQAVQDYLSGGGSYETLRIIKRNATQELGKVV